MPTVAEAFSGENNILPLDGRGLDKHHQPGDSAQCCHRYQLTPAPPPPRVMQKMVRSTVLPEEQETHHYSFTRPKVPSCRMFVGLRDPMFAYSCRKKERKKRDKGGVGGREMIEIQLKLAIFCWESRKGSSVRRCRPTAQRLIPCGNMQNGAAEEVLSLCSPRPN